ncbi:NAD(P)-binding protein [Aspergillus sclerotioniger CBS 115572]|uniref:NAD(P)-binding protein n=1 Tax=Aspergillus sclerotioniger CBS 115572 TaxID=1450535 RepID=A0A317WSG2_9EURO|nr:NAD(P)-binding protein [Aspergillus sclerotioniger CBS 115572]PWY88087.1 NAD(P)-binding protein [Aspergillus sclerotioniger CBS 115572]
MPTLSDFIHTQFRLTIPIPTTQFTSKTVLITGATGGLGKEIATHIVRLNAAKVILACRNPSRGNETKHAIEATLQCNPDIIEVWEVDIESAASIKGLVNKVNKLPRLDVVINNAGISAAKFQRVYGTEKTLAVNCIGNFLLALQVLPKLRETARSIKGSTPCMTFVGSALYDVAKWPETHGEDIFEYFGDGTRFGGMNQYNLSKLIQLYSVIKLASIVDPVGSGNSNAIVINSLDPCFCKTGLGGDLGCVGKVLYKSFEALAARTPEEGSRLVVQAASAERETHGLYFRAGAVQEYAPIVRDEKKAEYLWEVLSKRLEGLEPGIMKNVE